MTPNEIVASISIVLLFIIVALQQILIQRLLRINKEYVQWLHEAWALQDKLVHIIAHPDDEYEV